MKFYRDWIKPKMISGEIVDCKRQIPYELQKSFKRNGKTVLAITYVADFVVTFFDSHVIVFANTVLPLLVKLLASTLLKTALILFPKNGEAVSSCQEPHLYKSRRLLVCKE
jgi:hypothetical protein